MGSLGSPLFWVFLEVGMSALETTRRRVTGGGQHLRLRLRLQAQVQAEIVVRTSLQRTQSFPKSLFEEYPLSHIGSRIVV